jgi:hypothetical protein
MRTRIAPTIASQRSAHRAEASTTALPAPNTASPGLGFNLLLSALAEYRIQPRLGGGGAPLDPQASLPQSPPPAAARRRGRAEPKPPPSHIYALCTACWFPRSGCRLCHSATSVMGPRGNLYGRSKPMPAPPRGRTNTSAHRQTSVRLPAASGAPPARSAGLERGTCSCMALPRDESSFDGVLSRCECRCPTPTTPRSARARACRARSDISLGASSRASADRLRVAIAGLGLCTHRRLSFCAFLVCVPSFPLGPVVWSRRGHASVSMLRDDASASRMRHVQTPRGGRGTRPPRAPQPCSAAPSPLSALSTIPIQRTKTTASFFLRQYYARQQASRLSVSPEAQPPRTG